MIVYCMRFGNIDLIWHVGSKIRFILLFSASNFWVSLTKFSSTKITFFFLSVHVFAERSLMNFSTSSLAKRKERILWTPAYSLGYQLYFESSTEKIRKMFLSCVRGNCYFFDVCWLDKHPRNMRIFCLIFL